MSEKGELEKLKADINDKLTGIYAESDCDDYIMQGIIEYVHETRHLTALFIQQRYLPGGIKS